MVFEPCPIIHFLHAFFRIKVKATQDNPILRGLFLTSTQQAHDASLIDKGSVLEGLSIPVHRKSGCQDLFIYNILSKVLPSDRDLKIKFHHKRIAKKRYYQRLLATWWVILIGGTVYLGFSYTNSIKALMEMGQVAKVRDKQFKGALNYNLSLMAAVNNDITQIKTTQKKWFFSIWPYSSTINTIVNNYQQYYVKQFNTYVLPGLTKSLNESADLVMRPEHQHDFGFVVENIVDKVNLIQARLNLMPSSEFQSLDLKNLLVSKDFNKNVKPNNYRVLYKNYMTWNLDFNALKKQRGQLLNLLDSLDVFHQPFSWLIHWVNKSSDIQAIKLSDYWPLNDTADQIEPVYTEAGSRLIQALFKDMTNIQLQSLKFERYSSKFFAEYHTKRYQIWHQFTENFKDGLEYIPSQESWYAIAQLDFFEFPYIRYARNLEKNFIQVPLIKPPEWLKLSHQLYQYYQSATLPLISENKDHNWWRNAMAHINHYIKNIEQGHDAYVPHDNLLQAIVGYQKTLLHLQQQVLALNENSAFEVVQSLFLSITSSNNAISAIQQRFYDAYNNLQQIKFIATTHFNLINKNQPIWDLYNGMFDLLFYGTMKQAMCYIQKKWADGTTQAQSLSILSPHANLEEIFGEQRVIHQFMNQYIDRFIVYNTDKKRYVPKAIFGHSIDFSEWVYAYAKGEYEYRQLALLQKRLEALLKAHDEMIQGRIKPTNVNKTATLLPSSSSLTVVCDGKRQVFSNYNMLSDFLLTGDIFKCTSAVLSIDFKGAYDFSAIKKYRGTFEVIKLFYHFLDQGQLTFKETDFPSAYSALKDYNIKDITIFVEFLGIEPIKPVLAQYIRQRSTLAALVSQTLATQDDFNIARCWGQSLANKSSD